MAIAVVSDADDPSAGHTYPYHFTVTSENADEISLVATENPDVYLVAYCGTRVSQYIFKPTPFIHTL